MDQDRFVPGPSQGSLPESPLQDSPAAKGHAWPGRDAAARPPPQGMEMRAGQHWPCQGFGSG